VYHLRPVGLNKASEVIRSLDERNIDSKSLFLNREFYTVNPRNPELCITRKEIDTAEGFLEKTIDGANRKQYAIAHLTEAIAHRQKPEDVLMSLFELRKIFVRWNVEDDVCGSAVHDQCTAVSGKPFEWRLSPHE